jgi:hypothetical protein
MNSELEVQRMGNANSNTYNYSSLYGRDIYGEQKANRSQDILWKL